MLFDNPRGTLMMEVTVMQIIDVICMHYLGVAAVVSVDMIVFAVSLRHRRFLFVNWSVLSANGWLSVSWKREFCHSEAAR
jgi:hypothetical protein